MEVSIFQDVKSTVPTAVEVRDILQGIKDGQWKSAVQNVRKQTSKNARHKAKQLLACVLLSGIFKGAKATDLITPSGLLQIDLDNIKDPPKIRDELRKDPYLICAFISPSATGVKGIVRIPPDKNLHKQSFQTVAQHFKKMWDYEIDPSTKNINRKMYVSFDPDLWLDVKKPVITLEDELNNVWLPHNYTFQTNGFPEQSPEETAERLVDALNCLNAEDYDCWIRYGMALKKGNYFDIWHNWSASAGNYKGHEDCWKTWQGFDPNVIDETAIFRAATDAGWKKERKKKVESSQGVFIEKIEYPPWWMMIKSGRKFSPEYAAASYNFRNKILHLNDTFYYFNSKYWDLRTTEQMKSHVFSMIISNPKPSGQIKTSGIVDTLQQLAMLAQAPTDKILNDSTNNFHVFSNGTLNLETREFQQSEFDPDAYITIYKPYLFDPLADCPRWLKFLDEIELDADTQKRLQEWFGYCLVPHTKIQKSLMIIGDGSNGKSVFLSILRKIIGEGNVSSLELYEIFDRFKTVQIENKLANIATDIDPHVVLASAFKKIVSGELQVAERKHVDAHEFKPFVKLIFSTNSFAPTRDHTEGFYRRFDVVRFNHKFEGNSVDPYLTETLENELSGILNWSLQGLERLEEQHWKLSYSSAMSNEHDSFREQTNPLQAFINECCNINDEFMCTTSIFLAKYREWLEENGHKPQTTNRITSDLRMIGIVKKDMRTSENRVVKHYIGLNLL